jgi:hypothetical protein
VTGVIGASAATCIYREVVSILRDQAASACRTGVAVLEASLIANFDQLNRMAETKELQERYSSADDVSC